MSARERMLTLRLMNKIDKYPVWADRLGVAAVQEMAEAEENEEPP